MASHAPLTVSSAWWPYSFDADMDAEWIASVSPGATVFWFFSSEKNAVLLLNLGKNLRCQWRQALRNPDCVRNWQDIQEPDDRHYQGSTELLALDAPFSKALGLTRLGIRHQVLPPGRRTSYPHAESDEEEFVYVIEGTPSLWLNGALHPLRPGDGVGFPAGTGVTHSFLNNSDAPAVLLVVGEPGKPHNKVFYPVNPEQRDIRSDWWADAPPQPMGGHDGVPDKK
jgi:uncharacterized cupin superfamily protein